MKQLTKQQRHEIYKEILKDYEKPVLKKPSYLCGALADSANLKSMDDSVIYFEEFALFKPTKQEYKEYKCNITWFSDEEKDNNTERKIVLDLCIEMTK